jgi:carboxylate-amine ligase
MDSPQSRQLTLGVEEEFQLLCPETLALVPGYDDLAACWDAEAAGGPEACPTPTRSAAGRSAPTSLPNLKSELHQSCCEVVTRPCETVAELDRELRSNRHRLARVAESAGMAIGLSGTHPSSLWHNLPITREPRRLDSEYLFQEAHRQCLAFALHIHVGVPDRPTGLRVMNDARVLIPILYALSCSSPFLEGRRTGLKSSRILRAFGFPRTGIPDSVENIAELDAQIASMRSAGLIADAGQLWWDIRLHHVYPTVEFRVADAVPRVKDVTALAALTQAFVAYLLDAYRHDICFEPVPRWILCENRWRAARFGTDSELVATSPLPTAPHTSPQRIPPDTPGPRSSNSETLELQSIQSIVAEVSEYLMPVAAQLGTARHLEQCQRIAQNGSAADRQLAIAGAGDHDLGGVVRQYCQETLDI